MSKHYLMGNPIFVENDNQKILETSIRYTLDSKELAEAFNSLLYHLLVIVCGKESHWPLTAFIHSLFFYLLLALLIMSIGKVLFSLVQYYFVFSSFYIVYMFLKLCKSFIEKKSFHLFQNYLEKFCRNKLHHLLIHFSLNFNVILEKFALHIRLCSWSS